MCVPFRPMTCVHTEWYTKGPGSGTLVMLYKDSTINLGHLELIECSPSRFQLLNILSIHQKTKIFLSIYQTYHQDLFPVSEGKAQSLTFVKQR